MTVPDLLEQGLWLLRLFHHSIADRSQPLGMVFGFGNGSRPRVNRLSSRATGAGRWLSLPTGAIPWSASRPGWGRASAIHPSGMVVVFGKFLLFAGVDWGQFEHRSPPNRVGH